MSKNDQVCRWHVLFTRVWFAYYIILLTLVSVKNYICQVVFECQPKIIF